MKLSYNTQYGGRNKSSDKELISSSINYNEVIGKIINISKEPILFSTIVDIIKKEYPSTERTVIENYVFGLVKNEYLISELRPVITLGNPFDYVINKLSKISGLYKYYTQLLELKNKIDEYNNTNIGNGIDILLKIFDYMKNINLVKNYLQVDLLVKAKKNIINKSIMDKMAKVAEFLWKISSEGLKKRQLDNYRMEFIEKYDEYREVPILELLDPNIGLGVPAGYLNPSSTRKIDNLVNNHESQLERYVLNELSKNLVNSNEQIPEINIDDFVYRELENIKDNREDAIDSMELYFEIEAKQPEDIDEGNYILKLSPNTGSDGAGKTFGRFINMFDYDVMEKLSEINKLENQFYENTIIAELVYLADYGRATNVSITNTIRDYELVLGTNSSKKGKYKLDINDLVIGINNSRFYIRSKSLNKRIIVKTSHMLNIDGCHNICRFLKEISSDGLKSWSIPQFKWMDRIPVAPRIKFENVIIVPANWNLSFDMLDGDSEKLKKDFEYFKKKFTEWSNQFKVPRYSYIIELDNKILLDLKNDLHMEIIKNELFKTNNSKIKFYEFDNNIAEQWIKGEKGTYLSEIVVPFIRNKEIFNKKRNIEFKAILDPKIDEIRDKYIGSEWVFFKLYGDSKRQDEFIFEHLNNIANDLLSKGIIKKYFFMRYADPKEHIRLRFNLSDRSKTGELILNLNNYFDELIDSQIISNIVIDKYEREIERYGGPDLIECAENLFFYDSELVEKLLKMKNDDYIKINFDDICIFSIISYLDSFGLSDQEKFDYMDSITNYKNYLKEYRNDRKALINLCNRNIKLESKIPDVDICNLIEDRVLAIKDYRKKIDLMEENKKLMNSKKDIILSVIHLHCNRMIGIDRTYEKKLNTMARHTIKDLNYIYSKCEKNNNFNKRNIGDKNANIKQ